VNVSEYPSITHKESVKVLYVLVRKIQKVMET